VEISVQVSWFSVWAKSACDDHGQVVRWLPLHQHLDDAAGVAGLLVDEWVSPQVLARIARDLHGGVTDVRALVCWLAGVHDVGKASPAFASKVPILAGRMSRYSLATHAAIERDPKRREATHALVGHVAVRDWLVREHGFERHRLATWLGSVVGSHHGVPPESSQFGLIRDRTDLVGAGAWASARDAILDRTTGRVGGRDVVASWASASLTQPSLVLLTAIVVVADWISSNSDLFPLWPVHEGDDSLIEPDDRRTARRLEAGWAQLGLPPRWAAEALGTDLDQVFRDRFRRPTGAVRPVQVAAVETVQTQRAPGMVLIEAPMGSGKTEAALLAAEELAHRSGADGCFIALPTQATSDAMFGRVLRWLEVLPGRVDGAQLSVNLAHGKAALNDMFTGLAPHGRFTYIGDDEDADGPLIAHQWMTGRKKAMLAAFVVGTIDQLLFGALKSRHLMLRHLALAGKVVIIDEVHAYDVYMSQYLDRVLHWLGSYGVPVVLLSATLPVQRRAELLQAYESTESIMDDDDPYPVVHGSGGVPLRRIELTGDGTAIAVDRLPDDLDTLISYLRRHLSAGGCAAVVRNTVTRVQETADRLVAEFGVEHVTVNHSRFLSCDRARTDRALLAAFGPPGESQRPALHIVVASQVLEQSLDVDFDLLITDLAPMDLVLQRAGRLHRHDRSRPAPVSAARCGVVGVENWAGTPVRAVPGSRRVYGEHTLLRAAALLADRGSISLPGDIAPLVRSAYSDEPMGPSSWTAAMEAAANKAESQAQERINHAHDYLLGRVPRDDASLIGWVRAGTGDPDDDNQRGLAQVRDGEESLEVLVVTRDTDGGLCTPDWIERGGGQQLPLDDEVPSAQARVVASCGLRLPLAMTHPGVLDDVITALEANKFTSFHRSRLLRGQLVLVLGQDRLARVQHGDADFLLTYDLRRGLIHERA
jgi:CRISPR-associated helicase Cas3/CRISPR-associated endonuclease Cas3-HD